MNEKFVIRGGKPLEGSVCVGGAKNAAVAILPATILAEGPCIIENLPRIDDVTILLNIMKRLGASIDAREDGSVLIDTSGIKTSDVRINLVRRMRASYYLVGALLGRFLSAKVYLPGGCAIGQRPIDLHKKGIAALGANMREEYGCLVADAEELVGSDIYLDQVSVGATINIMLAAVKAKGSTTIMNAAKEPHVVDVANFLNCMGARIKGAGTDTIKIRGVEKLHGCTYSVIPDQIEAGTLMIAAAATKGDVTVKNVVPVHMEALTAKLEEMGVQVEEGGDSIRVCCTKRPKRVNIKTYPYPGFPTDLQQPATVLLSTAEGTSVIVENIFENRYSSMAGLQKMGAQIRREGRVALVEGVKQLHGAKVCAEDLRGGAGLVLAALAAEGPSQVEGIQWIERGYEHFSRNLAALGAKISKQ